MDASDVNDFVAQLHDMEELQQLIERACKPKTGRHPSTELEEKAAAPTTCEWQISTSSGDREFFLDEFDNADASQQVPEDTRLFSSSTPKTANVSSNSTMSPSDRTYAEVLNSVLSNMEIGGIIPPSSVAVRYMDCSHPGCTRYAKAFGKCRAHGGITRCKHPGCTQEGRWRGCCDKHDGRRECSEENCKTS